MPLTISAFRGTLARSPSGSALSIAQGAPAATSAANMTGVYTVPADCSLIKIKGTGTIQWGAGNVEPFDGIEYRGVTPGDQFTVA